MLTGCTSAPLQPAEPSPGADGHPGRRGDDQVGLEHRCRWLGFTETERPAPHLGGNRCQKAGRTMRPHSRATPGQWETRVPPAHKFKWGARKQRQGPLCSQHNPAPQKDKGDTHAGLTGDRDGRVEVAVAQLMLVKMWGDTGIWMEGNACGGKEGSALAPGAPHSLRRHSPPSLKYTQTGSAGGGMETPVQPLLQRRILLTEGTAHVLHHPSPGHSSFFALATAFGCNTKPTCTIPGLYVYIFAPPCTGFLLLDDVAPVPWDGNGYTCSLWIYTPCPCTSLQLQNSTWLSSNPWDKGHWPRVPTGPLLQVPRFPASQKLVPL